MDYFTERPQGHLCSQSHSAASKEEMIELDNRLLELSAHELRKIIMSAASESSNMIHLFAKIIKDGSFYSSQFQPVQQVHQSITSDDVRSEGGLLTPIDSSEDSEMSGAENSYSHMIMQPSERSTRFRMTAPILRDSSNVVPYTALSVPKRLCNKRKSLADRNDNIPTAGPSVISPVSKRRKSSGCTQRYPTSGNPHLEIGKDCAHCLNCGLWIPHSKFDKLHDCIYHPGALQDDGHWSCCGNVGSNVRGCLITRHRDFIRDNW